MKQDVGDVVLTLNLTVNETNVVLQSLGKHPFDEIAGLISKIKRQGDLQIAQTSSKPEETETETETEVVE